MCFLVRVFIGFQQSPAHMSVTQSRLMDSWPIVVINRKVVQTFVVQVMSSGKFVKVVFRVFVGLIKLDTWAKSNYATISGHKCNDVIFWPYILAKTTRRCLKPIFYPGDSISIATEHVRCINNITRCKNVCISIVGASISANREFISQTWVCQIYTLFLLAPRAIVLNACPLCAVFIRVALASPRFIIVFAKLTFIHTCWIVSWATTRGLIRWSCACYSFSSHQKGWDRTSIAIFARISYKAFLSVAACTKNIVHVNYILPSRIFITAAAVTMKAHLSGQGTTKCPRIFNSFWKFFCHGHGTWCSNSFNLYSNAGRCFDCNRVCFCDRIGVFCILRCARSDCGIRKISRNFLPFTGCTCTSACAMLSIITRFPNGEKCVLLTNWNISFITDVIIAVHDLIFISRTRVPLTSAPPASFCSRLLVIAKDQMIIATTSITTDSLAITQSTFSSLWCARREAGTSYVSFSRIEINFRHRKRVSPLWSRAPPLCVYTKDQSKKNNYHSVHKPLRK